MSLRPVVIIALACTAAFFLVHHVTSNKTVAPQLESAADAPTIEELTPPPTQISASMQEVLPNLRQPVSDWRNWIPPQIDISPVPGTSIPFTLVRLKRGVDQGGIAYTTWIGRPAKSIARSAPGWHLVGVGTARGWQGILTTPAGIFDVLIRNSEALVRETNSLINCGIQAPFQATGRIEPEELVVHAAPNDLKAAPLAALRTEDISSATRALSRSSAQTTAAAAETVHLLDIVLFYDKTAAADAQKGLPWETPAMPAMTAAEVPEFMSARYRAQIEACNLVLEDSGISNFRWNLVGAFKAADYDSDGRLFTDHSYFNFTEREPGISANAKVKELSGDLAVLICGQRSDYGGLGASLHATIQLSGSYLIFAHEVGHCMGLMHDRVTDAIPEKEQGYGYGHMFNYAFNAIWSSTDAGIVRDWRVVTAGDVMSYAGRAFPYFASPALWVSGTTIAGDGTIDDTKYPLGVAADHPRAADAARHLREVAATTSGRRRAGGEGKPPAWVEHPPRTISASNDQLLQIHCCAANADSYTLLINEAPQFGSNEGRLLGTLSTGSHRGFIRAANAYGHVDSPEITFTITAPNSKSPTITSSPANLTVPIGGILILKVAATDAQNYQWLRNGLPVGANSFEYLDLLATPSDAGSYTVKVSNSHGTVESVAASVTVTVEAGTNPSFSSIASPTVLDANASSYYIEHAFVSPNASAYQVHTQSAPGSRAFDGYSGQGGGAPEPSVATMHFAEAANQSGATMSSPVIVGYRSEGLISGRGTAVVADTNIRHPNGNIFDQVKLEAKWVWPPGPWGGWRVYEAVTAHPGKVTRTSFVDVDGDIVQVEFSGAGTLSLNLENTSVENEPRKYHQPGVSYASGRAGLVVVDADETTNVSIFTVGRGTAFDPTGTYDITKPISPTNDPEKNGSPLFDGQANTAYDGVADVFYIAVLSRNGKFGGLRAANARFGSKFGYVGIYAPGVAFQGPLFIGDISADGDAIPIIEVGSVADARITGGDMLQANGAPITIGGITNLQFAPGVDSAGRTLLAQTNRAKFMRNGVDVTSSVVRGP